MRAIVLAAVAALLNGPALAGPFPNMPPAAPAAPPACAVPGQWWQSYTVSTAGGQDTYAGVAADCTAFRHVVPAGTALCVAMGMACPLTGIAPLAFIRRFTAAEQAALMAANPTWGVQIAAAGTITVTDPALLAGLQAAVTAGVLTQARMTQVLNLSVASP